MRQKFSGALALNLALILALPQAAHACACGCGVFQVSTNNLLPTTLGNGTLLFTQVDYLNQTRDWSGSSSAPAAGNADKDIRTLFQSVGLQTMLDRNWGLRVEVPYWQRHFTTLDAAGSTASYDHGALGDLRVMGMYTGFSSDRSSGLMFGLKLATGDWTYPNFDRDTEIGTGTTDLLLGGYRLWKFGADGAWGAFVQTLADLPAGSRAGYRPGKELDTAFGIYPQGWDIGGAHLTPVLQALLSLRDKDSGVQADPDNSGYQRLVAAPGVELAWERLRVDLGVGVPVYQHVNGNQLVAPWQGSLNLSYAL